MVWTKNAHRNGYSDAVAHRGAGYLEMAVHASMQGRSEADLRVVVQKLLDKKVNPSIANHGGKISLVDVREGTLFITMSGGCQGCGASQRTLRNSLEVMVKKVATEINEIVDVTDHAAGKKPFYPPTRSRVE